jgi:hypothetical protein
MLVTHIIASIVIAVVVTGAIVLLWQKYRKKPMNVDLKEVKEVAEDIVETIVSMPKEIKKKIKPKFDLVKEHVMTKAEVVDEFNRLKNNLIKSVANVVPTGHSKFDAKWKRISIEASKLKSGKEAIELIKKRKNKFRKEWKEITG